MGFFFRRIANIFTEPLASMAENFEYSENWPGSIPNVNYHINFTGFNTPLDTASDSFEVSEGWT